MRPGHGFSNVEVPAAAPVSSDASIQLLVIERTLPTVQSSSTLRRSFQDWMSTSRRQRSTTTGSPAGRLKLSVAPGACSSRPGSQRTGRGRSCPPAAEGFSTISPNRAVPVKVTGGPFLKSCSSHPATVVETCPGTSRCGISHANGSSPKMCSDAVSVPSTAAAHTAVTPGIAVPATRSVIANVTSSSLTVQPPCTLLPTTLLTTLPVVSWTRLLNGTTIVASHQIACSTSSSSSHWRPVISCLAPRSTKSSYRACAPTSSGDFRSGFPVASPRLKSAWPPTLGMGHGRSRL